MNNVEEAESNIGDETDDGDEKFVAPIINQGKEKQDSNKRPKDSRSETPSDKKGKLDMPAAVISLGESIVKNFASVDFGGGSDNNKLEEKLEAWITTSDTRMTKLGQTLNGVNDTLSAVLDFFKRKNL